MDRTDAKIDKVEAKVDGLKDLIHSQVKDLLNMIGDHGQRIVRLEERQKKPE